MVATVEERIESDSGQNDNKQYQIIEKEQRVTIWALTLVDEATALPEVLPIDNKKRKNIALLVDAEGFC